MIKSYVKKYILLMIILITISVISALLLGKKQTIVFDVDNGITSIEQLNFNIGHGYVKIINKRLKNNKLYLTVESVSKGRDYIDIQGEDYFSSVVLYSHKSGIITKEYFLGKTRGDIVFAISNYILLLLPFLLLIQLYRNSIADNLFQYKNVAYLGILIFLGISLFNELFSLFNYQGLQSTIDSYIDSVEVFSHLLLPFAFVTSVLVSISNIVLLVREGFKLKNMLGFILGLFLCFLTFLPELLYQLLYSSVIFDVHNEKAVTLYIYDFIETSIYGVLSYLECVLLGTIIVSIKAAREKPKYNKDYVIILGCKIRNDGSLTNLLKSRIDKALDFRNKQLDSTGKDLVFVPSGGKGSDEVMSESLAMKKYLLDKGIKEKNILIEDKSKNTLENFKYSSKIIKSKNKNANIAFSTNKYHVFRAGIYATSLDLAVEGMGSNTRLYYLINAFIREFIATIVYEKRRHIGMLIWLLIVSALMVYILWFSNTYTM